jgi:hypothetical protein
MTPPDLPDVPAAVQASAYDDVRRLADFIIDEVPGEPSESQGAIDTAIRLLRAAYPRMVDPNLYSPLELQVAGLLSTFPPYDQQHPTRRLPMAREVVKLVTEWEPDDAG